MKAFKLFRKLKDGNITPLFINKKLRLQVGVWLNAEKNHSVKGFAYRPFWHCTSKPEAPHLSEKGRVWYEVEIDEFEEFKRPDSQGGLWYTADKMKIIKQV